MATSKNNFDVGLWYVVTYANGTRKKFKFEGGEPPLVYIEGEDNMTLEQILFDYVKIECVTN